MSNRFSTPPRFGADFWCASTFRYNVLKLQLKTTHMGDWL